MDFILEARRLAASVDCTYDSKTLRLMVAGLLQILMVERKRHAEELRDLKKELE